MRAGSLSWPPAQRASGPEGRARMVSYTYVLKSEKDNELYIGSTSDLTRRIKEHNSGKNKSTKSRKPFKLVYCEKFDRLSDARYREYIFKKSHSVLYRAAGWQDDHC